MAQESQSCSDYDVNVSSSPTTSAPAIEQSGSSQRCCMTTVDFASTLLAVASVAIMALHAAYNVAIEHTCLTKLFELAWADHAAPIQDGLLMSVLAGSAAIGAAVMRVDIQ